MHEAEYSLMLPALPAIGAEPFRSFWLEISLLAESVPVLAVAA